jgi:ribonuclease J
MEDYPPERLAVITTGSQGEPMAALTRMAMAEHRRIEIVPGDTVIISASPIPGNERLIGRTINHLFRQGAEVIYHAVSGVHVSGHASQEELKLMINLIKPRYFIPIHGEYRMLVHHARLAEQAGLSPEHVMIAEIGDMVEISAKSFKKTAKVEAGSVMVDGLGVGDVGTVVLRDRQQLAQDGILVVVVSIDKQTGEILAGPEFVSRGFVYVRESERLFEEAKQRVKVALESCEPVLGEWNVMKNQVRDTLSGFFWERTRRRPMILPVVMET